jgi:hypothetical protein
MIVPRFQRRDNPPTTPLASISILRPFHHSFPKNMIVFMAPTTSKRDILLED